jgi:hypothetical protein
MIRRSTVVYIIVLALLAAAYGIVKYRAQQPEAEIEITPEATVEAPEYLFTAADGTPTGIRIIASAGDVVEVTRDANSAWRVIMPIEGVAEQGASEAAASQITTMRVLDTVPEVDLDLVGIKAPDYILNVKFGNGMERTIKVGVVTPTESGYYVQDAAGGDVLIVSKSSLDAILGLLTAPPYLETPIPSPTPT